MLPIAAFIISVVSLLISIYILYKSTVMRKETEVLLSDSLKDSWSQLSNPNSYESKQLKRSVPMPKRR